MSDFPDQIEREAKLHDLEKRAALALRDLATATGAVFQVRAFKREDLFTAANGGRAAKSELVMEVFPYKGDKK